MAWPNLAAGANPYWTLLFDDAAAWSAWNATKSDAAGHIDAPHFDLAATINVESSHANGWLYRTLASPVDLSGGTSKMGYVIEVQCYLDSGALANLNQIVLRFCSGSAASADAKGVVLTYTGWANLGDVDDVPGWRKLYFTDSAIDDAGANWVDTDWANITHIVVMVSATGGGTVNLRMGSIRARPTFGKPVLCMQGDDGPDEHLWYANALRARGIRGTFFCIEDKLDAGQGGDPAYLSWDEALAMQADGHLICNHTKTFGTANEWSAASVSARAADVASCRDAFLAHGLNRGARILATPGGEFDTAADAEWAAGGDHKALLTDGVVDHVRLVRQLCRSGTGSLSPYLPYPSQLGCVGALNYIAPATAWAIMEQDRGVYINSYHGIGGGGVDPSQGSVEAFLDYMVTKRDAGDLHIAGYDEVLDNVYGLTVPHGRRYYGPGGMSVPNDVLAYYGGGR